MRELKDKGAGKRVREKRREGLKKKKTCNLNMIEDERKGREVIQKDSEISVADREGDNRQGRSRARETTTEGEEEDYKPQCNIIDTRLLHKFQSPF